ncbi:hypothetical protein Tco_0105462 [Tanacetum coccineum]
MTTLMFADTHNMVVFLSKPAESKGFEQIVDFLNPYSIKHALKVNPIIYTLCIEQFWATVKAKTVNREVQLQVVGNSELLLLEVILNGNKVLKRTVGETEQEYEPTTAEEKQDRRNEMKARGTLLMAIPNKDQLNFHSYKDENCLWKPLRRGLSSETMDQTFDRLQKLISQLEIQGKVITQEDMNLKLLRSLSSECKTHALIWRNKEEIETISLDDLYNNLKIYEPEISGLSSTSQNPQMWLLCPPTALTVIAAQMKQITWS